MRIQSRRVHSSSRRRQPARSSAAAFPALALGFAIFDAAFLTLAGDLLKLIGLAQ